MHANHKLVTKYINVAKGQLEGINRMIEEDKYCLDISNQILASIAMLKKANHEIISAHLKHCVVNAKGAESTEKIDEIIALLKRIE